MRSLSLLALVIASLTGSAIAHACMHPLTTSRARVKQSGQQALILFHDGIEELVLKVDYVFDEDDNDDAAATELAWVIPVPSIPSHYAAEGAELFADLDWWVELEDVRLSLMRSVMSAGGGGGGGPSVRRSTLELLPTVEVGPYEIQPMRAQGEGAGEALNEWMRQHSFAEIPDETLQHYITRRWTFLAVRASASDSLGATGSLPPLSIRFATERPVYPLKFSTHMGTFPVRAYLITGDDLPDSAFAGATQRGFVVAGTGRLGQNGHLGDTHRGQRFLRTQVREFRIGGAPPSLRPLLGRLGLGVEPTLVVRVLRHRDLAGETIAGWDEDLAFPAYANQEEATAAPFAAENAAEEPESEPEEDPAETLEATETAPVAVTATAPDGCACRVAVGQSAPPIGLLFVALALCWRRRWG